MLFRSQVAANPYVTVLGDPKTASSRLTLTQAFNSLGTTVGPLFGGILILAGAGLTSVGDGSILTATEQAANRARDAATVQGPYLLLAGTLLLLAVFFAFARLPRISHSDEASVASAGDASKSVLEHRNLLLGAAAIFLYVGGEVSIGSFLVSYFGEGKIAGLPPATAAHYVSYYWGLAMIGRFIGFAVMRYVSPGKTLAFNAACSIVLILTAVYGKGSLAMWAVLAVGLCNSIMFPTIFSMALHRLGRFTGQASGILCMAIVGGAIVPLLQGYAADHLGLRLSFYIPAVCYAFILFYGVKFAGLYAAPGKR